MIRKTVFYPGVESKLFNNIIYNNIIYNNIIYNNIIYNNIIYYNIIYNNIIYNNIVYNNLIVCFFEKNCNNIFHFFCQIINYICYL